MTKPKHYLYSCTIQINTRGRVPVERKRYAYVTLDGFIKLACNAQDVPAYTADTLEYAILEEYRNGFNAMGLERRVSLRKFRDSQYDLNRSINEVLGGLAMAEAQINRIESIDKRFGLELFGHFEPRQVKTLLHNMKNSLLDKQEELGIKTGRNRGEPHGLG